MADLSKILQQESEGIMFPFKTGVQSTTTEQQVYDSATDGIMTVQGQQYSLPEYQGPTATIQYGTEEQGYPRMLREIEQGELPQFRQEDFPKAGEGRTEISTPTTQPITTTPFEPTTPAVDPCPAGYQLINGVCQPIQQDKGDSGNQSTPFNIKDYSPAITRSQGSMNAGAINSMAMMELEKKYGAETASAVGLMNQKYNNRGAMVKELKDEEGNVVTNPDGTIKVERIIPNPANSVGEVINDVFTAIGDVTKLALDNSLIGKIANGLGYTKEQAANVYKLTPEQQEELIDYQEKNRATLPSGLVPLSFGNFGLDVTDFGNLPSIGIEVANKLNALNNMLKNNRDLRNNKVYVDKKNKLEKKQKDIAKANKENNSMNEYIEKNGEDNFAKEVDKKYANSNYTTPVQDAAKKWDSDNKKGNRTGYTNTKTNTFVKETKAEYVKRAARNAQTDPSRKGSPFYRGY
jgi:hypothetical protein